MPNDETATATNASRRRTIVTVMNDGSHDSLNDGEVIGRNNPSIPPNQSDMSGDEDGEESQRCVDVEKKISPTRTSMVNEFADKISPNEYKCKLCSKIYRCGTGTNANIRRHLVKCSWEDHFVFQKPSAAESRFSYSGEVKNTR